MILRKLYKFLCKLEVIACGTGFMLLIAMVFLAALLRFFRFSVAWNIDLALFLLAWTAFLGADIAWRDGKLIGIDLLTKKLPSSISKIVQFIVYLIVLTALVVIVVNGSRLAWLERLRRYQSIPIPFSLMTLSLIVACSSMIVTTLIKIKRLFFPGTVSGEIEEAAK